MRKNNGNGADNRKESVIDDFDKYALPSNLEAERSILGAIMLDSPNYTIIDQASEVHRDEFHLIAHRYIFDSMKNLREFGMPIDMITVTNELRRLNKFEEVGGATYLASLIDGVPRTDNVFPYNKIVKQKSRLRKLILAGNNLVDMALRGQDEPESIIALHNRAILDISRNVNVSRARSSGDLAYDYLTEVENISARPYGARLLGLPTGFNDFDELTSGQRRQRLIIVAARPGHGKTAILINVAIAVAAAGKMPLIFSLEMSAEELIERLLCAIAHVDSHRLRHGYCNREEWGRLADAARWLVEHPILIDDTGGLSPLEMRIRCRIVQAEYGLDWLGVDYLQIVSCDLSNLSREQQVTNISNELKFLAKDLDIPIVAAAQLSRAPDIRANHRPQLADLRESGGIEQAADIVTGLYRDEKYNPRDEVNADMAELIVLKHRGGLSDKTFNLIFKSEWTRFFPTESAPSYEPERVPIVSESGSVVDYEEDYLK